MQHIIDLFKQECGSDWSLEELQALSWSPRGLLLDADKGAACAILLDPELAEEWCVATNTCLIEEMAVAREAQGKGLGTLLARQIIEWSKAKQAPAIIALCWESGQRYTSRVMLEKLAFKPIGFIEHAFVGLGCPYCGSECSCAATILSLEMEQMICKP